jgi:RNA polymerase sigma-70 factor, ECF subfamily
MEQGIGVAPARSSSAMPERSERVIAHTGTATSDEELVARTLEGSAWAEAALCRLYVRPLAGMLTRLLGNAEDADDIAQDAFVTALETLSRLRTPSAFKSWLFRIAANLAKKKLRRRRFERFFGLGPAEHDTDLDIFGSRALAPDASAELVLLEKRVLRLPIDLRIAWSLRFVEGYELTEVAEICECSLATIKRRIERASTRLDAHIELERKDR